MHATFNSNSMPMIRKLESIFTLTGEEREALINLRMQVMALKENHDIVCEGDRPGRSCLLLSGFTGTYKVTGEGKRQIVSFGIPGDIPDLQSLHLNILDWEQLKGVGDFDPTYLHLERYQAAA